MSDNKYHFQVRWIQKGRPQVKLFRSSLSAQDWASKVHSVVEPFEGPKR